MEPAKIPKFPIVIEREMIIGKTKIHIKSVFSDQRKLDDALASIVKKKLKSSHLPKV